MISLLWFLVVIFNGQNGQRKNTCSNVLKHYKWGDKSKVELWYKNSQQIRISCQQTIEMSYWQAKEGYNYTIISTRRDKEKRWGITF
jgi:wobble nucleotide-excising tRNase